MDIHCTCADLADGVDGDITTAVTIFLGAMSCMYTFNIHVTSSYTIHVLYMEDTTNAGLLLCSPGVNVK